MSFPKNSVIRLGVILSFLFMNTSAFSQAGLGMPYKMTQTTPALTLPATAFTTVTALNLGNDVQSTVIIPAGYPGFTFAGVLYDGFTVSTNGWLALTKGVANGGASPIASSLPVNSLAAGSGANVPILAPLWDDLTAGAVGYQYTGGFLWIRWTGCRWQSAGTAGLQFHMRLNPATGAIDFVYITAAYSPVTPSASIGIAGPCTGDYYSVKPTYVTNDIDSTVENSALTVRPANMNLTWTPNIPYNDNCAGAISIGSITGTCTPFTASTIHATASASGAIPCSPFGTDNQDVWFSVIKPVGVSDFLVTTNPAACSPITTGTSVQVFSGTCAGGLTSIGCSTTSGGANPAFGEVSITGRNICTVETLLVRVTGDANTNGKFTICTTSTSPTTGGTCGNATGICSIPYSQSGMSTLTFGNDYDSTSGACHSAFMNGEDYVFSYTPPVTQCLKIAITNTGPNPGIFVMDGCPNLGTTNCLASVESGVNSATVNSVTLIGGQTYYIVIDNNSGGGSITFDINITLLGSAPANDDCGFSQNLGTVNLGQACAWSTDYTTDCATPSAAGGYPNPGCAGFVQGTGLITISNDVWFRFTAGFVGNIFVDTRLGTTGSPIYDGGMAVYTGICGAMTLVACDDNSGTGVNMPALTVTSTSTGQVFYVRVWSANVTNSGTFQICLSANCVQPNDLPCNAQSLLLGTPVLGNNQCAGNASEPAAPGCWVNGTINTVWYTAVVPPSGRLNVKASVLSNPNTQIAAYLFPSGCGTPAANTLLGCNDNTTGCPCTTPDFGSEVKLTGLTPGATVYIAVDGNSSNTGEFFITAVDGNNTYPPLYAQDCNAAINICSNTLINVTNASTGIGNICDPNQNLSGCFSCGERSGVWYTFTANPPSVQFSITPGPYSPVANFDFAIWNVTGSADPCLTIASLAPMRCNNTGPVGVGSTGLSSLGGTGFGTPIPIATTTTFILALRNWDHRPVGYKIDWMGTNIISPANPTLTWTGAVDSAFETGGNWECFSGFTCSNDLIIPFGASVSNQPVISTSQSCHDLSILAGASLHIKTGVTLSICGDMNVYGSLKMDPGSTIRFTGTEIQMINGGVTAVNAFANLTVDKTGGSVTTSSNIDVRENFSTINSNFSVFNLNAKYMKVGKDFYNFNGTTTFTGFGSSTVEFNGATNQNFTNQTGSITLNRVFLNKTIGTKVYLMTSLSTMNVDSFLVFGTGNIVTPRTIGAQEVNIRYYLPAAISGYGANSFVDGRMRRKIANPVGPSTPPLPASFDFPLGDSLVIGGYELANITFVSTTVVNNISGYFAPWPGNPPVPAPPTPGPAATPECNFAVYNVLPFLNNGYWNFERPTTPSNGIYRVTLFNTGYTNNAGANGWSMAKADMASNPFVTASWSMFAKCSMLSTLTATRRDSMNAPLYLGSFNHFYATVQSESPLPIELLYFNAQPQDEHVLCSWETASEINNAYFEVERSMNGTSFVKIGEQIPGYGLGTSTQRRSYSMLDYDLCDDIVYYRLKQVDIDGKYFYSDVVAVNCKERFTEITLHPNPARSNVTITYNEPDNGNVVVNFIDYTGRVVLSREISSRKGFNQESISIEDLSNGIYYVDVRSSGDYSDRPRQIRFIKN